MNTTQQNFIDSIVVLIQKYAKAYGYHVSAVAAILAQAICESNWGQSKLGYKYHNYFGMKCGSKWTGSAVNLNTKEEYTAGTLTSVSAFFRVYSSIEEGVKGYFDFISASRYANLKKATTSYEYLDFIKADGYATSSTYVKTLTSIINTYGLTRYNVFPEAVEDPVVDTVSSYSENVDLNTSYPEFYPACTGYMKNSIIDALKYIGVDSSLAHRKQIAATNGISDYKGTAAQNKQLLVLLKAGQLIKEA